jgi:hypothetical protein
MDIAQNYIKQNLRLIQTMVIKSSIHATLLNAEIKLKYPYETILENNPETWRYYLHISGNYHPLDRQIHVTSFDTQQDIVFNSFNLLTHKQTRKNYLIGTKNYYILIKKYPELELFIKGALYPVDINDAIAANDNQILYYDQKLVEPQEISLINKLQQYLDTYTARWNVSSFISSDDLYPAAQYAIMTLNLYQKLINIRFANCHTAEAHSFHIKNYLASHYGLDVYMPYMSLEQQLFLYRNIRYIERNAGKVETFKTLVHEILENRDITPLYELSVKQKHELDSDYRPKIHVRKKAITKIINAPEKDYFDIVTFENYQRPLATLNDWYLDNFNLDVRHKLASDNTNTIKTKYLLSDIVDYSDMLPYTFQEALLKHWVSMATNGSYNTYVAYYNLITNTTEYLHVNDAFIYMLYLTKSYYRQDNVTMPTFINSKQLKFTKPTVNDTLALLPANKREEFRALATDIIARMPTITYIINTEDFSTLCMDIHNYAVWQWELQTSIHDLYNRAYVKNMCDYMFMDVNIVLDTPVTTFTEFLTIKGLAPYEHSKESRALATIVNLFEAATGYNSDKYNILKNIQEVLILTMKLLSSYSIDFIKQINTSKINLAPASVITVGAPNGSIDIYTYINDIIDIEKSGTSCKYITDYDLGIVDIYDTPGKCQSSSNIDLIELTFEDTKFCTSSDHSLCIEFSSDDPYDVFLVNLSEEDIANIPNVV